MVEDAVSSQSRKVSSRRSEGVETCLSSDTWNILFLGMPTMQRSLRAPCCSCQVCPTKMGSHGCGSPFHFQLPVGRHRESYKTVLLDLFCHFFVLVSFLKTIWKHEYFVMDCEGLEIESCKLHISQSINVRDAAQKHGYLSLASSVYQVIPAGLLDVSKWI